MVEVNRTIVNYGLLLLSAENRECESFSLYCQIERKDLNASMNFKRPRPSSFYGYAQGLNGGYVMWERPLTFENEEVYFWQNPDVVGLVSQDCQTKTILDTIDNLAVALGLTPLGPYTGELKLQRMPLDAILFKLFGKTTLYVRAIFRDAPVPCSVAISWQEREDPVEPLGGGRVPFPPPNIPVNLVDPNRYDLADPPYDGEDDDGDTYAPPRPNCTGCTVTIIHQSPGQPRYPGGPPAPNPSFVVSYAAEDCPISVEVLPDDGGASFPKSGDYVIKSRNGTVLNVYTSYTFNPFVEVNVDNGECF